ncbi:DnaD domain protein, partial [Bacillus cereus]|nr:DnaD domain protein [Bacillus cereus]
PNSEVYKFYEQNISSLSPYIVKELKNWIQRLSGEKVLEVLKIAFENNKKTLAYVRGILRNWCSEKLKDFSGEKCVMGSLERRKCILSSVF